VGIPPTGGIAVANKRRTLRSGCGVFLFGEAHPTETRVVRFSVNEDLLSGDHRASMELVVNPKERTYLWTKGLWLH
jgi:hypothetical protein